ncbi:IclR family transcriptional regulator [Brevibacterium sp.]|uniref:IclR family transcriptional regulator n=1 Tax=Brevibacterium sp. TaxID=1701 RepID=UPI0028123A9F|nr:IclR family transcriptional regulator [Brevibacterium sp.]
MPRLTPALMRAFDILELFGDADRDLASAEIVERTNLPRTSVHELLMTLVERKYLQRDDTTGRYRLGLSVFRLGNAFADQLDLHEVGQRVARQVAAECDETVNVGILDGFNVVYLCKIDSTQAVRMISRTGGQAPASCTGVGKALLAYLPDHRLEELAKPGALAALTPRSITDPRELLAQMQRIRETGVAFEAGESTPDVSCAAAPVRNHRGEVVASLSVSVPDMRWRQRSEDEWAELVRHGARRLSEELGAC